MSAENAWHVLVVDDDPRVRVSLQHLLDQAGDMQVIAVGSEGAAALLAGPCPALVRTALVDIPGTQGSGLRLVEQLARTTAVVAMGLHGSAAEAARAAGACEFVEKDGDADDLLDVIRAADETRPRHNDV